MILPIKRTVRCMDVSFFNRRKILARVGSQQGSLFKPLQSITGLGGQYTRQNCCFLAWNFYNANFGKKDETGKSRRYLKASNVLSIQKILIFASRNDLHFVIGASQKQHITGQKDFHYLCLTVFVTIVHGYNEYEVFLNEQNLKCCQSLGQILCQQKRFRSFQRGIVDPRRSKDCKATSCQSWKSEKYPAA